MIETIFLMLKAMLLASSIHFAVAMMCLPQYAASVAESATLGRKIVLAGWWIGTSAMVYTASYWALDIIPDDWGKVTESGWTGTREHLASVVGAFWSFAAFPFILERGAEIHRQRNTLK